LRRKPHGKNCQLVQCSDVHYSSFAVAAYQCALTKNTECTQITFKTALSDNQANTL